MYKFDLGVRVIPEGGIPYMFHFLRWKSERFRKCKIIFCREEMYGENWKQ
jgi:hypothetical protein